MHAYLRSNNSEKACSTHWRIVQVIKINILILELIGTMACWWCTISVMRTDRKLCVEFSIPVLPLHRWFYKKRSNTNANTKLGENTTFYVPLMMRE